MVMGAVGGVCVVARVPVNLLLELDLPPAVTWLLLDSDYLRVRVLF